MSSAASPVRRHARPRAPRESLLRSRLGRAAGVVLFGALLTSLACAPPDSPRGDAAGAVPELTWRFTDAALACDDRGRVFVAGAEVFSETSQILVTHSTRNGESWSPRFHYVNSATVGDRGRPQLATTRSGIVYVLWEDTRDGPLHVFMNRSLDGGATWLQQDRRVQSQTSRGRGISTPRMVAHDRTVSVVWLDDFEGFEAFYSNLSTDAGETWLAHDQRITDIHVGHKSVPALRGDDRGGLYLAWAEQQGALQVVRFTASQDHGRNWAIQAQTLSYPGMEAQRILPVDIAILDSGVVLVTWTQYRNGAATTWVARSEDRGFTWYPPTQLHSARPGLLNPSAPRILADGFDRVHVAWQAMREDRVPLLIVQSSQDRGRTWSEKRLTRRRLLDPYLVDYRTTRRYEPPFSMAGDGNGNVFFAWVDVELGMGRLGFRRLGREGVDVTFAAPPELDSPHHAPATTDAPRLCADLSGHVYLLWNEARSLAFGTSPFLGDAGWRFERF